VNEKYYEAFQKPRREVWLGSYADGVVYVVCVLENPSPRQSLDGFIAEQTASSYSVEWNLKTERNITHHGVPGKAFVTTVAGDGMVQFFFGQDRLYEFHAFGAAPEDPRVAKFFASLSFAKTKDAVEVEEGPGLPFEQVVQPGSADEELAKKSYVGKDVTTKARLGMKPEPSYTEIARQNAVTGTVVLKCVFASNGSVNNIRTVSGLPYGLTERAIEAARRIKFIPATKDGKYVSMWYQLEYNFNLY
jgi:TonB family protein